MAGTKSLKNYLAYLIIGYFFLSCANQLSPPGGDKDTTPPTIISTSPENKTTNFSDNEIEFSFSEYVNKRNMNDAFFISPLVDEVPEFSWTNKTVTITFNNKFKANTTYSVIIGTEIADVNNNNKMAAPFILTFSTGNKIDSSKIIGKVYADKVDGTLIFAYKNPSDTLNISKSKPDYISQVDKEGNYKLFGLGNGTYELFAIKDEFKNLVYDKGEDKIGYASNLFHLSDDITNIENVNFFLTKEDTLPPNIQSVTMTDKNHLIVEFDESIDSSKLSVSNFEIADSTNKKNYSLKYLYRGNPTKKEYVVCTSDSLSEGNEYYLIAENIFDRSKNKLEKQEISFTPSERADTNSIKINKINTLYSSNTIDYLSPNFDILFSDAFNINNLKNAITVFNTDSTSLPIEVDRIDDASISVKIKKELIPKTTYRFSVDLNYIKDISGNVNDTTIVNKIATVNNLEFSGASGKVIVGNKKNVKVVLQNIERKTKNVQTDLSNDGKFNYDRVNPGKYFLWIYNDSDSNNVYSYGNFEKHKFAEEFKFYPDTLNLRSRWPVGDIEINFEK